MTYSILKTQYENYSNSDQYDSNSEDRFNSEIESDLKEKIDLLDQPNASQTREEESQKINDNFYKEWNYTLLKSKKIIPIIMEKDLIKQS